MENADVNVKNWKSLIKPSKLDVKLSDDKSYAKIIAEPLEKGFGQTIGNSLRRILLSSIQGAAVTAIQIDGVLHEFSSIKGPEVTSSSSPSPTFILETASTNFLQNSSYTFSWT